MMLPQHVLHRGPGLAGTLFAPANNIQRKGHGCQALTLPTRYTIERLAEYFS